MITIESFPLHVRHQSFQANHDFLSISILGVKVMAWHTALTFEKKLKIILEIDPEQKQVDAAKKYGVSQSMIVTFLEKKILKMLWKETKLITYEKDLKLL